MRSVASPTFPCWAWFGAVRSSRSLSNCRFCSVAAMVRIGAPNHPFARASQHRFTYVPEYYWAELPRDANFFEARRADACHIGNDVWLGHGAIVLPGNRVGDGAVIAAGAVVTHDVAPYTIVAGVPARAIRPRGHCCANGSKGLR